MAVIMDTLAHESLADYIDKMRDAGIVTSEEANRMARDFDKGMDNMKRNMKAAATSMAVDMLGLIDVAKKSWTQIVNIFTLGAKAAGEAAKKAMAEAGERPPPQDVGTGGAPRTIATPGPSEADIKKAEEAYERIAIAAAKATGKVLEAIELERAARNRAMDEELAIAEKKYMELLKLPGKAEEAAKLRFEAEQKYQNEGLISEQKYADDRAAVLNKWAADAITILEKLGPDFEKATQALKLDKFMGDTGASIQVLEHLKDSLGDTHPAAAQLGAAIAKLQTQMVDAAQKGFVPATEAAKKTSDALKATGDAAKKAADDIAEAEKRKAEAWKQALAAAKAMMDNISKLNDLYWKTADAAAQSAIKRAEAEGRMQDAISLTRDHLIEMAEEEDATTRLRADALERLTGDWQTADKIREMSNQATMDKIVVAEEAAADKRLAIETKLNADRTARLQAWADQMNKVNEDYIAKVEGSFIVSTQKIQQQIQQTMQTFTGTLPPKPGGGLWTVNELLGMGQTHGLNAMSLMLGMADSGTQQQASRFSGVTINIAQAPNQDPQALVRALMPTLRAEMARGTV
jgi:hypothetical protein